MTVRTHVYDMLLTTAARLVDVQDYLIAHPEIDPDDELFDEVDRVLQTIIPTLQRLSATPKLPPQIEAFLERMSQC